MSCIYILSYTSTYGQKIKGLFDEKNKALYAMYKLYFDGLDKELFCEEIKKDEILEEGREVHRIYLRKGEYDDVSRSTILDRLQENDTSVISTHSMSYYVSKWGQSVQVNES